jgi:nitrite reductase/ring-hydroxylating ferredoxin subunit
MAKVCVGKATELGPGECKVVEAAGRALALYNVDGTFYATDNTCHHRGGPLGEGILQGHHVICPLHYWKYDVRTGQQDVDPKICLRCYPVSVEGGDVLIDV